MSRNRRWNVLPRQPGAEAFAARLGVSPIIAQVLLNRGISDPEVGRAFLHPSLMELHDPLLLSNMAKASTRIAEAIRGHQKIVIYGDYDVDGITATATLWHAIKLMGGEVEYYIPHRIDEGYGMNPASITQLCDAGARLIISVDCGITALAPASICREHGADLIITDHHEPLTDGTLPDCFCIVHPRLTVNGDLPYPNPHLCGSGVAFKLAWAIGQQFAGGNGKVNAELRQLLLNATSLAALATIADVVPLLGENRILAHFGLLGVKQCSINGMRALLESAGLLGENVDSFDVGFRLAPRLNACGRMGHAAEAVELLTLASPERATEIATYLDQQNRQRQTTEREVVDLAMAQITELGLDQPGQHAIVVGGKGWHAGVIGIVASRIVDRYQRPAIVVSLDDESGHGSGRSILGFHLANALAAMGDLLEKSGGHAMAAGLSVHPSQFEAFRAAFVTHANRTLPAELLTPELRIEDEASLAEINRALVDEFTRLGPFGPGNPRPLLVCRDVELLMAPNVVGKAGDHLQLRIKQGNTSMKCIAFKFADMAPQLKKGSRLDIVAEPTLNTFNGYSNVELEIKDIKLRQESPPA